jgi:Do/DeqQ family serine protease
MRKLSIAILFAVAAGSLTLCAENSSRKAEAAPAVSAAPAAQIEGFAVDHTPIDRSNSHEFTSYAPALSKVTPSVVTVATSTVVRVMKNRDGADPMQELLRRYYGLPSPEEGEDGAAPQQGQKSEQRRVPNGMGSGVIVSSDGLILTNNHVVCDQSGEAADEITVTLPDGREMPAKLVGRDPQTDVALIRIDAKNLPAIAIADSDNLQVGDVVFAVGNPMGLSQTVTMGIVSAVGRSHLGILGDRGYEDFIQTDAPINPGNSGGALVDAKGRLVGINTAILSRTGGSIGIGFAIPSNLATNTASNLLGGGKVERGYLGVTIRNLDPTLAESFGVEGTRGSLVENVVPDSPAAKAGLKRGDVITAVDGRPVSSDGDLRIYIVQKRPGSVIKLTYVRDGKTADADVTLSSLSGAVTASDGSVKLLPGVSVQAVTDDLARKFNLDSRDGVVVTNVETDSAFAQVMVPGMQILEINGTPVKDAAQAAALLRKDASNRLWISFRGRSGYLGIRIPGE